MAEAGIAPEGRTDDQGLIAQDLVKQFRGRRVVDGVSVQIRPGEVIGLLGPNGAGKTTSFHLILGLMPPKAGRVRLDGRDITTLPMYMRARRGIGYLPQEASIFRRMTVEENLSRFVHEPTRYNPDNILGLVLGSNPYLVDNISIGPPFSTSDDCSISFEP